MSTKAKFRRYEAKGAQEKEVKIVSRHTGKGEPRAKWHTGNEHEGKGHKGKGAQEQRSTRVPSAQLKKYTREKERKGKWA